MSAKNARVVGAPHISSGGMVSRKVHMGHALTGNFIPYLFPNPGSRGWDAK